MTYPDPLPFKLRVLRALTDGLKDITPANGYVSNIADFDPGDGHMKSRVFRGRAWFGDDDALPMVSVLENDAADAIAPSPAESPTTEYDWPLLVQGFVEDDPENPTDPAYVLLADVRRWLSAERRRKAPGSNMPDPLGLGINGKNRILGLRVGPGVVRPADDVSAKAYFWLTLELRVTDNAAEPYL